MGKSAVRLAVRNASAHLVLPSKGVPKQPAYVRGGTTIASSPRLLKFRSCIAAKMAKAHGDRVQIRTQFANSAKACAAGGG